MIKKKVDLFVILQVRGKLIDAIETVSSIVSNPDQLDKTVGVLGSVVEVPDEVTDEKKVNTIRDFFQ